MALPRRPQQNNKPVQKEKDERLPASYDEDSEEYFFDEIADILYGEETTAETEMLRALVFEEIQTALAGLPKEQREVFEMTDCWIFP